MEEWYKIVRQTPDREIEAWLRTITVLEQTQELHESFVQALERSVTQPSSMETLITGLATKGKDADPRAHAAEAVENSPKLTALLGSPTPSPSAGLASMATTPNVNSVGDKEEEETAEAAEVAEAEGETTADSEAPLEGEAEAGAEDAAAVEGDGDEDENMLDADDAPHDAETTAAAVAELGIPSATEGAVEGEAGGEELDMTE
jgi:hypothetical protein